MIISNTNLTKLRSVKTNPFSSCVLSQNYVFCQVSYQIPVQAGREFGGEQNDAEQYSNCDRSKPHMVEGH